MMLPNKSLQVSSEQTICKQLFLLPEDIVLVTYLTVFCALIF